MDEAIGGRNFGADSVDELSTSTGAPLPDLCDVSTWADGVIEKPTNDKILSVTSYSSFTTAHAFSHASCAQWAATRNRRCAVVRLPALVSMVSNGCTEQIVVGEGMQCTSLRSTIRTKLACRRGHEGTKRLDLRKNKYNETKTSKRSQYEANTYRCRK